MSGEGEEEEKDNTNLTAFDKEMKGMEEQRTELKPGKHHGGHRHDQTYQKQRDCLQVKQGKFGKFFSVPSLSLVYQDIFHIHFSLGVIREVFECNGLNISSHKKIYMDLDYNLG